MKALTIIFFSVLLPLSLLAQFVISPAAGEGRTSKGIVVAWAIGEVIEGDIQQGVGTGPMTATASLSHSDGGFADQTMVPASLIISPNPAKDRIAIEFNDFQTSLLTLRILNYTGQEVYQQKVSDTDNPFLFDVSSFTAGAYILQAVDETHKTVTEKLFIF